MIKFLLSWIISYGDQAVGGNKKFPMWEDIDSYLKEIETKNGSVTLDIINEGYVGAITLQVIADEGKYILTLGEDDGSDYTVRSYNNKELKGKEYEILGDIWDGSSICTDFEIVKNIFKEFFNSTKVSNQLLN